MMLHEPNVHTAKFGKQHCEIEVSVGCSAPGPLLVFVAEAFVRDESVQAPRPIVGQTGEALTIHAETEVYALTGMLRLLEHHLGPVESLSAGPSPRDCSQVKGLPWPLPTRHRKVRMTFS